MDIKALIPVLASVAPTVGSILGSFIPFPGGALLGQKLGEGIAKQFGLTPTATAGQISDAIVQAGEETARAKITAALEIARKEIDGFVAMERAVLEAQVKNLSDVNATMRAEALVPVAQREHWFFRAWRPAFAWGVLAVYVPFGLVLSYVAARAAYLSSEPLKALNEAWPLLVGYFGVGLAVVGVLIPSRSMEKKAAIEAGVPMPNAKPIEPAPASIPLKSPTPIPAKPPTGIVQKPPGSRD